MLPKPSAQHSNSLRPKQRQPGARQLVEALLFVLGITIETPSQQSLFDTAVRVLAIESYKLPSDYGHFVLPRHSKSLQRTSDSHQVGVNARCQQRKTRLLLQLKKLSPEIGMVHVEQLLRQAHPRSATNIPAPLARALGKSPEAPPKVTRAQRRSTDEAELGRQAEQAPAPADVDEMLIVCPSGEVLKKSLTLSVT
jgi:hypothetical protein